MSTKACVKLVTKARAGGSDIEFTTYPGATHDFDDPGKKRQSVPENAAATRDATEKAVAFFAAELGKP